MKFLKQTVCILASVLLILSSSLPSFATDKNSTIPEIDITINPDTFQKMLLEDNFRTKYPVKVSVDGKPFSAKINSRGNYSYSKGQRSAAKRLPYEISFESYADVGTLSKITSLKLINSLSLYRLMAEYTALKIYEFMGVPVSKCTPVFISFNGVDYGLYLGIEEINEKNLYEIYGENATRNGNLYKSVDLDNISVEGSFITSFFGTLQFKCGNKNHDTLSKFLDAVNTGKDFEKYLNLDEVIRFFACTAASGGNDTLLTSSHNVYLYEYNGKISFIPWDLSFAFDFSDFSFDKQSIIPNENAGFNNFFTLLMKDEKNKAKYYAYIEEIRESFLKPEISGPFLNNLLETVKDYYKRDRSMIYDPELTLENITSGNILTDGNIILAVSETYKQLGEQVRGEVDSFYVPDSMSESIETAYPQKALRSDSPEKVLTEIKRNYLRVHLDFFFDKSSQIVICVFSLILLCLAVSHIVPKIRYRKRHKT